MRKLSDRRSHLALGLTKHTVQKCQPVDLKNLGGGSYSHFTDKEQGPLGTLEWPKGTYAVRGRAWAPRPDSQAPDLPAVRHPEGAP